MKTRIFLTVYILLLPFISAQSAPLSSQGCDSLCHKPLLLHFRFDRSLVEYDYMDNPRTLKEFYMLFSDSFIVSRIDTMVITSYSSPDGDSFYNRRLAYQRAMAVKGYLIWKYPLLDQYRILIHPQGEDWNGLRQLVETDEAIPSRKEVLDILDKVADREQRKVLLRRLNHGSAYQYIHKHLLPELRNAAVCTVQLKKQESLPGSAGKKELTLEVETGKTPVVVQSDDLLRQSEDSLSAQTIQEVAPVVNDKESIPAVSHRRPVVALKTNLLTWAGITSDGKLSAFRPNLAAEVFFARRWSLGASASYSYWKGGKGNNFRGVSEYSIESRFWLWGDGAYRWLYLGAYGQSGDFDYRSRQEGDVMIEGASSTGTYWSTGLSLGIYFPLNRHWGVEAGLRGGYRKASAKAYDYEPAHNYYHHDFSSTHWGITGLNFSLTYRWLTK
nr:DUF3575 domain-containing protein [uncultured Bacteroides sp.]